MKRKLLYILIFMTALTVWAYGDYYGRYMKSNFDSVSVRLQDDAIAKQDILLALENEKIKETENIPVITAWKQVDDQNMECNELGTKASLSVIEFWGEVTEVMPIKLVKGSIAANGDETGCLIDENAAYRLFRTRDAVGRSLIYQGKSYCIRGIIKAGEGLLILPVTDDKSAFSNLEFVYSKKESGKKNVRDFMEENGLADDYTIVEGCFYARLIQVASGLPLWLLGFSLLYLLAREGRKRRIWLLQKKNQQTDGTKDEIKRPGIKKILKMTGVFIIYAITVLLYAGLIKNFTIPIPERYFPTRWSDFPFWTKQFKEIHEQVAALKYLAPATKDILMFQAIRRSLASSIITSALTIICILQMRKYYCFTWEMGKTDKPIQR